MSTKKLLMAICVVTLALIRTANAQILTGSITVSNVFNASATASSITFSPTNVIGNVTGDFVGTVPVGSAFLVASSTFISGLSTSPLTDSTSPFFRFSTAYKSSSGTSPGLRFSFEPATITENSYSGGIGDFSGTGTLVDNTAAYSSSAADFTLDFSSANNYVLVVQTVPEPVPAGLVVTGLLGMLALRRRRA